MERIEPETEEHRFQKALRHLVNQPNSDADILFPRSDVLILLDPKVLTSPGGQLVIALMVNLLARMKTAISNVAIGVPKGISLHNNVPLRGDDLQDGLIRLVDSLTGSNSTYSVKFDLVGRMQTPTVTVAVGRVSASLPTPDVTVGATAWTASINAADHISDWDAPVPIGFHIAATLAVAELFKHLLLRNFPEETGSLQIKFLDNAEFSALTYKADPGLHNYPHIDDEMFLDHVAIAGLGAGGSAALYSLACFPRLAGKITLIDPGQHKKSNLSRYLLSTYDDCHRETFKVDTAYAFLHQCHPDVDLHIERLPYADVQNRDFHLVVSTVDTVEGRWDIQRDFPPVVLETAVTGPIYGVLRVYPGEGRCLACKHPYDPEITYKRRAQMWGKSVEEVRHLTLSDTPVTQSDIEHLAYVQSQSIERFADLVGVPFNKVPAITECGDTRFNLRVPNQTATIPFVTTMAGILIASEIVKNRYAPDMRLKNWFDHNMLFVPKLSRYRFLHRIPLCHLCSSIVR